jgi:hypothetical protein
MKKTTLLLAGFALAAASVSAQSADDIINKYADAMGGRTKLAAIKNIYMEGSSDINGSKITIKTWLVNKKSVRQEFVISGMTNYIILRNDSGWMYFPIQGQTNPEPFTAEQVKSGQTQLDVGDELINYKDKGYKVTLLGKDDVDGTEAYKIEEKISDSLVHTYYIDPQSYYVIRVHEKATVNGKVTESDQDLSNYQKTADGYVFPMTESGGQMGDQKYTIIKVNTEIDSKLFSPSK